MRRSENIAFRLHRGRSAEDPRGSQGSEGTGWAPSKGMIDFPVRGRKAPGESIDFSFYLHRGRSAEDPRKTPAEVVDPEAHRATGFQILATGHRGRSAEDTAEVIWCHWLHFELRGLSSSTVGFRWLHWVAGYRVATGWRTTGWPPGGHQSKKISFACTAEDPRKTPAQVIFE